MQQGGSQYGVPPPEMTPFTPPGTTGPRPHMLGVVSTSEHLQQQQQLAEAASPISSRPPPPPPSSMSRPPNFTELAPAMTGSFTDEDALAAGEEAERGGVPGNRWPRQETLALLKIRSEMDVVFRDATLKGPLWEDVSRKLAELGYIRSAKKCKEKFENVHKYYKRTKDGRAGRQDGKSYRFFTQLEALHSSSAPIPTTLPALTVAATTPPPNLSPTSIATTSMAGSSARIQPLPVSPAAPPPITIAPPRMIPDLTTAAPVGISGSATAAAAGISFSSSTSSSSSDESDGDETEEGLNREGRKRKREDGSGGSRKMMVFFEGLMKQVMERQEAMQQRFLETIEKREQDRMIREEAWKRQEMSRLAREHELMAQERALTASRDAAVIAFLQKLTGQTIQLPPAVTIPAAPPPSPPPQQQQPPPQQPQQPAPPPPPPPPQQPPQPQQHHHHHQSTEIVRHQPSPSSELVPIVDPQEMVGSGSFDMASSRWPKTEVLALIKLRSGLESRYQEAGPKGPLWEEISAGMQRLGYNRSSKRCKEKWENINKYFKKVKESKKKRPEDAKTCPYFHELDALYRRKLGGSSSSSGIQRQLEQEANPNPNPRETSDIVAIMAPPPPLQQPLAETENKNSNINNNRNGGNPESGGGGSGGVVQIQTSNGGLPPSFFEEGTSGSTAMKKPEDIVKDLIEQQHQQGVMDDYDKIEEADSDEDDDDDDDEEEDDRKMQYKIQFQRQNMGSAPNAGGNSSAKAAAAAAAAGSFLAMVQ